MLLTEITPKTHTLDILSHLKQLCATHDWYFQMADDSRAYERGLVHADEINYVRNVLVARGFEKQAESLIDRYRKPMPTFETMLKPLPKKMPPLKEDGRYDWSFEWNAETEEWE